MYNTIKRMADERGMSIMALEKAAGLSNGTIGKWRDNRGGITITSIERLAKVLDVSIDELINSAQQEAT